MGLRKYLFVNKSSVKSLALPHIQYLKISPLLATQKKPRLNGCFSGHWSDLLKSNTIGKLLTHISEVECSISTSLCNTVNAITLKIQTGPTLRRVILWDGWKGYVIGRACPCNNENRTLLLRKPLVCYVNPVWLTVEEALWFCMASKKTSSFRLSTWKRENCGLFCRRRGDRSGADLSTACHWTHLKTRWRHSLIYSVYFWVDIKNDTAFWHTLKFDYKGLQVGR